MGKNIILDMGNVCCIWDPHKIAKAIDEIHQDEIAKDLFGSDLWRQLDLGTINLEDALASLEEKPLLKYALQTWHDYFDEIESTRSFIETNKDNYHFYLLSNCSESFYHYYTSKPIFKYFKGFYLSCDHHLLKPNDDIYLDFLNTYQLKPEDCLFIDDVLENVEGARRCGMEALCFDYKTQTLEDLITSKNAVNL